MMIENRGCWVMDKKLAVANIPIVMAFEGEQTPQFRHVTHLMPAFILLLFQWVIDRQNATTKQIHCWDYARLSFVLHAGKNPIKLHAAYAWPSVLIALGKWTELLVARNVLCGEKESTNHARVMYCTVDWFTLNILMLPRYYDNSCVS